MRGSYPKDGTRREPGPGWLPAPRLGQTGAVRPLLLAVLLAPALAFAGMPSAFLTDVVQWRLSSISFFLALFLAVTFAVKALWNRLQRDVPRLPRLRFGSALALVFLWGLGFQLVLSMIAGGRELMTPGAWERSGATHRLTALPSADRDLLLEARKQRLEELRVALWAYAEAHGREFPPDDFGPSIPPERWRVLGGSGMHFIYVGGGQKVDAPARPLVYEPGHFGRERWVLFTDGDLRLMPVEQVHASLGGTP